MEGKLEDAMKFRDMWATPVVAVKPTDSRVTAGKYKTWRNFSKSQNDIMCHFRLI